MVAYRGVNHLALVTNDMDKTVRFYRDVVGMKLIGTTGDPDAEYPHRHYFFSLGPGSTLAFFEWQDVELPPRKDSGVPASGILFDHVSIAVESDADLDKLQSSLRDHGMDASDFVDHGFIRSLYCTDPNGISLEFSVWKRDLEAEPLFEDKAPVPSVAAST
ncbi:VOC family protein [Pseudonocardia sp. H11422]|uniref:VOC family protein n=1 Tax=Pseudonocardia sp. H11422 TaxID=2835866 RepID=UPI001BDD8CEB|nr:VOC family protein [Pseudonocardia sp. H11422]